MFESEVAISDVDRKSDGRCFETEELRKLLNTTGTRRCGRCQESVKFVVRQGFREQRIPFQQTQEEKWNANIQSVRVEENGTVRKAKVCTRCIRSGKVNRAI